jgi:hypothetical protein
VDGSEALVKRGLEFYAKHPQTRIYPPIFAQSWVSRDNVNDIIARNGFAGPVDLLSLDMDGVDYWILEAIRSIEPRVIVLEYQDTIGPDRALTVPYSDNFNAYNYPTTSGMPNYCGASLPAFVKLAKAKGYRLVGCNRYGYNAFFLHNSVGAKEFPEIDTAQCFRHPKVLGGMKERFPLVAHLPWVAV